jgi:hypothetical protein
MITYRSPQLRQNPASGPTFALRAWTVGVVVPQEIVPDWLARMRVDAEKCLTDTVIIVERSFGLSGLRTQTVTGETTLATVKGRLQRGAAQVNASESTQQGGVRRTEGYSLRLPVGTPIPIKGYVIVGQGATAQRFEITGHDPIRSESVLLTVWIAATEGVTD